MAILSTEETWFMGGNFKRVVRVLKDGKFRIAYPQIITDVTGLREAVGDTLGEAMKKFKQNLQDFQEANTTERKVIIYKIKNDITFSVGAAVSVAAGVYIEKKYEIPSTGKMFYNYNSVDRDDDLPSLITSNGLTSGFGEQISDDRCIGWTPARHEFFRMLAESMRVLKLKLRDLSENRDMVLDLADLGTKLLP